MQPIGVFAVAVGVVCLVLIAVFSLRGPRVRRRGGRGGFIPIHSSHDDADGGDGDGG